MKKCPLCKQGKLNLVAGNSIGRAIVWFFIFRPIWLILVIHGVCVKRYKCEICGKKFDKDVINKRK